MQKDQKTIVTITIILKEKKLMKKDQKVKRGKLNE